MGSSDGQPELPDASRQSDGKRPTVPVPLLVPGIKANGRNGEFLPMWMLLCSSAV